MTDPVPFKHREGVEAVLRSGGSLRRDSRVHTADQLVGTYKIRLRIATDPKLSPEGNHLVDDLTRLVAGLEAIAGRDVAAWFIRDSSQKTRFWVFEDRATGSVVSCLCFEPDAPEYHAV